MAPDMDFIKVLEFAIPLTKKIKVQLTILKQKLKDGQPQSGDISKKLDISNKDIILYNFSPLNSLI